MRIGDVVPTILRHLGLVDPDLPGVALPLLPHDGRCTRISLRQDESLVDLPLLHDPRLAAAGYRLPPSPLPAWQSQRIARLALAIVPRAPAKALTLANTALTLDPNNLAALHGVTLAAIALCDATALHGIADAFERIAPGESWGASVRGCEHLLRGDHLAAAAVLPRDPVTINVDSLANLAALWLLARRPAQAKLLYARMLELEPQDVRAELRIAACDTDMLAYATAERRLLDLGDRFPFEPQIYDQLQAIYLATGRRLEGERMRKITRSIA